MPLVRSWLSTMCRRVVSDCADCIRLSAAAIFWLDCFWHNCIANATQPFISLLVSENAKSKPLSDKRRILPCQRHRFLSRLLPNGRESDCKAQIQSLGTRSCTTCDAFLSQREARWRSGDAEDCKSLHAGSIPARASIKMLSQKRDVRGTDRKCLTLQ